MTRGISLPDLAEGRMFRTMTEQLPSIRFDYQPHQVGNEWHVIAIYPTGQEEAITGFKSEQEAKDWLNNDALVNRWLRAKVQ